MSQTTQVPYRWAEAWASGDIENLVALYSEDAVYRHPMFPEPIVGRDALRSHLGQVASYFADFDPQVISVIAEGNRVAAEIVHVARRTRDMETPMGLLPASPRVETPAGHFFQVNDEGLIREEHQYG